MWGPTFRWVRELKVTCVRCILRTNAVAISAADYPYAHRAAAAVANGKAAAALFAITAPENIMVGACVYTGYVAKMNRTDPADCSATRSDRQRSFLRPSPV